MTSSGWLAIAVMPSEYPVRRAPQSGDPSLPVCQDAWPPVQLTYSNVTSTLALFVALGGTSYAVTKLPRNSVGSTQVRDGSLQSKDLSKKARATARGPRGAQGPAGERGPSNLRIAPATADVKLAGTEGVPTLVRRMDNVPAGAWSLRFVGSPRLVVAVGLHTGCELKVNGDVKAKGATVVGDSANASQESNLVLETAVTVPAPFSVTVECVQGFTTDPPVTMNRPQIVATQVGEVVATP